MLLRLELIKRALAGQRPIPHPRPPTQIQNPKPQHSAQHPKTAALARHEGPSLGWNSGHGPGHLRWQLEELKVTTGHFCNRSPSLIQTSRNRPAKPSSRRSRSSRMDDVKIPQAASTPVTEDQPTVSRLKRAGSAMKQQAPLPHHSRDRTCEIDFCMALSCGVGL